MKVLRRRGRVRLRLEPAEVELMRVLLAELRTVIESPVDSSDDVLARLYPSAYRDDDAADVEYRSLTESSLQRERLERIAVCRTDLDSTEIDLSPPDAARRWIQVLNDLRLALGTRIDISENDDPTLDRDSVEPPRVVYYWLTAVQDSVVQALMD